MSDHPHGTVERPKPRETRNSTLVAPVPETVASLASGIAAVSRAVAAIRQDDPPSLGRLGPAHRHQAVLALQPTVGNAHVQRVLLRHSPIGAQSLPPVIQRGPNDDEAKALETAKADAVAAGASVTALEKLKSQNRADVSLGKTSGGREVKAVYFKGAIDEVALVIAGVHGSELSGVEVAERFIRLLSAPNAMRPFFTVVIVPQLFPDNVEAKRVWEKGIVKAGKQLKLKEYQEARRLWEESGRQKLVWVDATHYGAALHLAEGLEQILEHFKAP